MLSTLKSIVKKLVTGDNLPCYVIARKPLILISYFHDFYTNLEKVKEAVKDEKLPKYVFFQLGWHVETDKRVEEIREKTAAIMEKIPDLKIIFLANSPVEEEKLENIGFTTYFCHQNAFIDEERYPLYDSPKRFDAIYLARITPFKRHELAAEIESLKLIGDHKSQEKAHFEKTMRLLEHADWQRKVAGKNVSKLMSQAAVGLCLSAEEGAMFVSAEYLLSGIPLISTENLGGRNLIFPDKFAKIVPDDCREISKAVQKLKDAHFNPVEIREATLEKIRPHRSKFLSLLNEICEETNQSPLKWKDFFIHKFGLRTTVPAKYRSRLLQKS